MTKIKSLFVSLLLTLGVSTAIAGSHGSTLDLVKERGKLMCSSNRVLRALVLLTMLVFGKVLTLTYVVLLQLLYSVMLQK